MEITVKVPDVLAAKAQSSGVSPHDYVERLLSAIADAAAPQEARREQIRAELQTDWEHFQATGLHLDEDEVDSWLAGLEHGRDSSLPELHV